MKKLFLIIVIFSLFYSKLFAQFFTAIQPYQSTYWIFGDYEDQVKFQVSFKYPIILKNRNGIKFAYTQKVQWKIYNKSNPIEDINYNPCIFYENELNKYYIDFFRIGIYEHFSNGEKHEKSRGIDRGFLEIQNSIGKTFNAGIRVKIWYYYLIGFHNRDIGEYTSNSEFELFIKLKNENFLEHENLYCKGGFGGIYLGNEMFNTHRHIGFSKKYWIECGLSFRISKIESSIDWYLQYYRGYAEFLLDYNKYGEAFRIGIIFKN
jgi:phospholipase A1/A2